MNEKVHTYLVAYTYEQDDKTKFGSLILIDTKDTAELSPEGANELLMQFTHEISDYLNKYVTVLNITKFK